MTRRIEARGARLPITTARARLALLATIGLVLTAGALASLAGPGALASSAEPGTMTVSAAATAGAVDDRAGGNDRAGSPVAATPDSRPQSIAFLVVDGVYNTELTAPLDVLQHIRFHSEDDWPETFIVSPDGKPVRTFEGMVVKPDHSFASAPDIDVLVVPSAEHSMDTDLENEVLISWVRATGEKAQHVMSLCDGAFVLAKAGLLDGIPATTFPSDQDRFAEAFPNVEVVRDVSFVDAGKALTSVGGSRSFDVAMWLVQRLYGKVVADGIGGGLIIDWDVEKIAHRKVVSSS